MNTEWHGVGIHDFTAANYVAVDPLPRDQTRSVRLHEPALRLSTMDPITGREIEDLEGRPYVVDGDLTIYFESEETRREYLEMTVDHPFLLVDNPTGEGYDEG